jgi:hypothetical protein
MIIVIIAQSCIMDDWPYGNLFAIYGFWYLIFMTLNRMLDGLVHNLEFHGPGGKYFMFFYLCPDMRSLLLRTVFDNKAFELGHA